MKSKAFWREKSLWEMTRRQWEALCDGCGRCCMRKLEDEDTGAVFYTCMACRLLDIEHCRCTDYVHRTTVRPTCMNLAKRDEAAFSYLPKTCAYRILYEGGDLPAWHPLVSGDPESVHTAGISMRDRAVSEDDVDGDDYVRYIIDIDC